MKIDFENDFQQKVMVQSFTEPFVISTEDDVLAWRQKWIEGLKSWHSPYKALVDCQNVTVANQSKEIKDSLLRMMKLLSGFFLKKAVGFNFDEAKGHGSLPFPVMPDLAAAQTEAGVRVASGPRVATDFRGAIQLQNHFQQHVVELTFSEPVTIDSKEKIATLKSKLTNNLMQWHSKWSLIIDCTNLEFDASLKPDFELLEKFFRGFFLKRVVGYSPRIAKELYPFEVFRARHNAAARLENEGAFSGGDADCISRKT